MALERLVISPSQQPHNQYAGAGDGFYDSEQYWMQKLADIVKKRVDEQGWGIKCTVVKEGSVGGQVRKSNALNATEHVALHTNADGGTGTLVIHYPTSTKGAALAAALYTPIAAASDTKDVGIWGRSTYYETRVTKAPAVIIEYQFHDNARDADEIRKSLDEYAEATVKGLAAYAKRPYKAPVVAPAPIKYYEVRIHTSEPEYASYAALAKKNNDFIVRYPSAKDSFVAWGKGV